MADLILVPQSMTQQSQLQGASGKWSTHGDRDSAWVEGFIIQKADREERL